MNYSCDTDPPVIGDEVRLLDREFDLGSLPALRTDLANCGAVLGLSDLDLTKFVLAAYEVAVNAVRHGGGRGRALLWRRGDDVWCQITDRGPGIRHRTSRARATDRVGPGHGLWLVRQMCAQVDVESGPQGTEVLLRYPLSAGR